MTIDHIGFAVSDFDKSRNFYLKALEPLGIGIVREGDDWILFGTNGKGEFWFGAHGNTPGPVHLAFTARTRAQVQAFHEAAVAAGGKDHGAPAVREGYHPKYYGAFVLDPDGHNIEAICHQPET